MSPTDQASVRNFSQNSTTCLSTQILILTTKFLQHSGSARDPHRNELVEFLVDPMYTFLHGFFANMTHRHIDDLLKFTLRDALAADNRLQGELLNSVLEKPFEYLTEFLWILFRDIFGTSSNCSIICSTSTGMKAIWSAVRCSILFRDTLLGNSTNCSVKCRTGTSTIRLATRFGGNTFTTSAVSSKKMSQWDTDDTGVKLVLWRPPHLLHSLVARPRYWHIKMMNPFVWDLHKHLRGRRN